MSLSRVLVSVLLFTTTSAFARVDSAPLFFVRAKAKDKHERTRIANAGVAIEGVFSDSVTFLSTSTELEALKNLGISFSSSPLSRSLRDFPTADSAFHDYKETLEALDKIVKDHPNVAQRITIGNSVEGRELAGVRLSSKPEWDSLPAAVFVGCHHAREHLSVEMPLMLAQYLASNYDTDSRITRLLDTREVWIVPMVNPDGAEYDISTGSYQWWRKNRRDNGDGTRGVDLNRNYGGPNFGGSGSSGSTSSDTYHGPSAFSEPETQAVRDLVRARKSATVLLTFHTFSELVLWPWGYTNSSISNSPDRKVFETMGREMAKWNGYKPQKSSDLYITSGDTTDWAYDELGLFAFTFELSPKSLFSGGFYPGASAIKPTFKANIEPALYMIGLAENPYNAVKSEEPVRALP